MKGTVSDVDDNGGCRWDLMNVATIGDFGFVFYTPSHKESC